MNEDRNVRTVRNFTRTFKNQHEVEGARQLFHPGFQHHFKAPLPPGWEGMAAVGRMMNTAFPDVVVTEEDIIAAGDKVVERSSCVATNRGEFPPGLRRVGPARAAAAAGPRPRELTAQRLRGPSPARHARRGRTRR